ncbi:hypothetical protein [Jeongeupia chitinilytica]|uniref:PilZ domain-containing protein n=1 Tax=Jeongeupia chitinilytica TaxID=1041641 RepID=A0ABQ3GYK0_9NEIS|nr:hypothetical protein [Jeongeupia chitinilytica]GHD56403.1 hypothetical protein GCM10007350_03460 [Jeongeupia chitinilytica]
MFDFKALIGALLGRREREGVYDYKSATVLMQELPESDILQAQIEIVQALRQLNANAEISLKERLKTVPYLDEKALTLQAHLVAIYRGELLDEGAAPHQVLPPLLAFWHEMADAYRLCIKQALQARQAQHRDLPLFALRGLSYAAEQTKWAALRYMENDGHSWRLLHRLYQYAEMLGSARTPLQPYPDREITSAIREYTQSLMLTLAIPEKLQPAQVELTAQWLKRWSSQIELETQIHPTQQLYAVNLAGSTPPKRLRRDMVGENWRYWQTEALLQQIRQVRDALHAGAAPATHGLPDDTLLPANLELLDTLAERWSRDAPAPIRKHERHAARQAIAVWRGLEEAIRALRAPAPGKARQWELLDESASGFGIRCRGGSDDKLQVGELLGIQGLEQKAFSLGIIRRIVRKPDGVVDLGIETLASNPVAVELTPLLGDRSFTGLYAAENPAMNQGRFLVLPHGFYADHREFRLGAQHKRYRIRLGDAIEQTPHNAIARFAVLEKLAA